MTSIFNSITELITKMFNLILNLLPHSPFTKIIDNIEDLPYLEYINWFIPFDLMIDVTLIWLGAVGLYYLYMIILRWVKAID